MEKYRPTQEEVSAARNGSNELFDKNVPGKFKPNYIRRIQNYCMAHGVFVDGVYYHHGAAQQPKERNKNTP